jgi:hypothetical protein
MRYTHLLFFFIVSSLAALLYSCGNDDPGTDPVITLSVSDLNVSLDENPPAGTVLGTIPATTNQGTLNFTLQSESAVGAFALDETSGELSVDSAELFDFEINPMLSAEILVANGNLTNFSTVTVTLNDVFEGDTITELELNIWSGPRITFTKQPNADFTLEENQDRITDSVWITRAANQGIFNIKLEEGYEFPLSPADTEWAFGTTAEIDSLEFLAWENTIRAEGLRPPDILNLDMVIHLVTEDIYIDIRFLSWSIGKQEGGGGFSYSRTTED